ncbi:MAG: hypothetical protein NTY64_17000 [Deltaproteobacteria bacterium]|nr:hypothetical protein [Deltaproteobacteria bacterium]
MKAWPTPVFPRPRRGGASITDGFVKSPSAALHCILRRCGVLPSTPRELCALHPELFTLPSRTLSNGIVSSCATGCSC